MIVCHCNVVSREKIRATVHGLLDQDPHRVIVPGVALRALGCRGRCCNCFPQLTAIIASAIEEHREGAPESGGTIEEEMIDERRTGSHRAA